MEQLTFWFVVVVVLFVAVSVIKTVLGLVLRYVLFVAAAVLVYQERFGTEIASWMTRTIATEIATVAGLAFAMTSVIGFFAFRNSRLRFVLLPAIGLAATLLAAPIVAG